MKDNQYIGNGKNQQDATYDIDREPFEAAILVAMRELESSLDLMEQDFEDDPDSDDAYFGYEEIAVVGMGLIFHLTGEEKPQLTDREMHEFGKHPDLLEDHLFQNALSMYDDTVRTDLFWLMIVDKIAKAYNSVYHEMFPGGDIR